MSTQNAAFDFLKAKKGCKIVKSNSASSSLFTPVKNDYMESSNYHGENYDSPMYDISSLTKRKIHLENALEDSQTQVQYLTRKLEESNDAISNQKLKFRKAFEDLQHKLLETVSGRKRLIEASEQEMQQQEEIIEKLQSTLNELATSNQTQEQALLDARERIELLQTNNEADEVVFAKIRSILSNGSSMSFCDVDLLTSPTPESLARCLEKYVTSMNEEIDSLRNRVLSLEAKLNAASEAHSAEKIIASSDAAEAIESLTEIHEKEMTLEKTNKMDAENKVEILSANIKDLQLEHDMQGRLYSESQEKFVNLKAQLEELKTTHAKEKGELQSQLINVQYDLTAEKGGSEQLKTDNKLLTQSVKDLNKLADDTRDQLEQERSNVQELKMKDSENNLEVNTLKFDLNEKGVEIGRLREIAAQLRGDFNTKLAQEISETEKIERNKTDEKVKMISDENLKLREELSRVQALFEATEKQNSETIVERTQAYQMMQGKDQMVERLTSQLTIAEKKSYENKEAKQVLDAKLEMLQKDYIDLSNYNKTMKTDLEKSQRSLSDEKICNSQLRKRLDLKETELSGIIKVSDSAHMERRHLENKLKNLTAELEKIQSRIVELKKTKLESEDRLKEINAEKESSEKELTEIRDEFEKILNSKEDLLNKHKDAMCQLELFRNENNTLSSELKSIQSKYFNHTDRLKKKLRQRKSALQTAEDSLHTVKHIDERSAKIAANMQKEVTDKRALIDTLQTELCKACDKLEIFQRESRHHKKEAVSSSAKYEKVANLLRVRDAELKHKSKNEKILKQTVERLQRALKKAEINSCEAQLLIGNQEEVISKAIIKRNLEMMDKRIQECPVLKYIPSTQAMNTVEHINIHGHSQIKTNNLPRRSNQRNKAVESQVKTAKKYAHHQKVAKAPKEDENYKENQMPLEESSQLPIVTMPADVSDDELTFNYDITNDLDLTQPHPEFGLVDDDPVSLLLGAGDQSQNDDSASKIKIASAKKFLHDQNTSMEREVYDIIKKEEARERYVTNSISDNAEELCRQLHSRLDGLSKLGQNLPKH